jgi:hypothetical protein
MSIFSDITSGISSNFPLLAIAGLGMYQAYDKKRNADKATRMRQQWEASQAAGGEGAAAEEAAGPDMGMLDAGIAQQQAMLAQAMKYLAPYRAASLRMLPIMEDAYKGGIDKVGMLSGYLTDPKMLASMNPQTPSWNINVPLPESMKYATK